MFFEAINAYYQLSQLYDPEDDKIPDNGKPYLVKILNCPSRYLKTEFFKDCDLSESSVKKCINAYFDTTTYNSGRYRKTVSYTHLTLPTNSRV